MRNLGLIGGLGPGATVHYYRELAKAQAGELLIIHADMDRVLGDVQRGDRIGLAGYFARFEAMLPSVQRDIELELKRTCGRSANLTKVRTLASTLQKR